MLNEERRQDRADGIQTAEERRGDAVEAHARNGGRAALPLLVAREIQHRRAHAGDRAGDGKRQDDVALFRHAAVLCGVAVVAGRLQLIAEFRLVEHDLDDNGDKDRERDRQTDVLVFVEERAHAQVRQDGRRIGVGEHDRVWACPLLHIGEQHVRQIQRDPVEHDAGDDLVDVAVALEQAADRAEQRAAGHGQQHARQPAPAPAERGIQTQRDARAVLSRRADVEKADLVGKDDRKRAHEQRRGFHQRVAEILELARRFLIGKEVFDDGHDRIPRAVGIDEQKHDVPDQQTENNADQ